MSVTVVSLTFLGTRKYLIGLGSLLELLLSLLVTRVAIRVILQSHLPVGLLHVLEASVAGNPEHLIKIALGRGHRHGVSASGKSSQARRESSIDPTELD